MTDFPVTSTYISLRPLPFERVSILLRPSACQTLNNQFRSINLMSIAYAFLPELRVRLTPRGRACRGKP